MSKYNLIYFWKEINKGKIVQTGLKPMQVKLQYSKLRQTQDESIKTTIQ